MPNCKKKNDEYSRSKTSEHCQAQKPNEKTGEESIVDIIENLQQQMRKIRKCVISKSRFK